MWCTQCHSAFSWKSGKIERGVVHNPHYYEWNRNHNDGGRNLNDIPCGGMPTYHELNNYCNFMGKVNKDIQNIHQFCTHMQHYVLGQFEMDIANKYSKLRIDYLMDKFTEQEFKKKLQYFEKANLKKIDIRQVIDTFVNISADIFRKFLIDFKEENKEMYEEVKKVKEIYIVKLEKLLKDINDEFSNKVRTRILDNYIRFEKNSMDKYFDIVRLQRTLDYEIKYDIRYLNRYRYYKKEYPVDIENKKRYMMNRIDDINRCICNFKFEGVKYVAYNEFCRTFEKLIIFTNENLEKISKKYNSVQYYIKINGNTYTFESKSRKCKK